MHISEFNYDLPEELIAQQPLSRRDASRMLVVDRRKQKWIDSDFVSFPGYARAGDVLVINNTRVFPARLIGEREHTGGRVEILLLREIEPLLWEGLVRPGNRLKEGAVIRFTNSALRAELAEGPGQEIRRLRFDSQDALEKTLETVGQLPLPPYIKRPEGTSSEDRQRYQTVFARELGAIAAPTAGLHFTPETLESVKRRGVDVAEITLHVGYGTFEPVRVETAEEHKVRPEAVEITAEAAGIINSRRATGGRVITVGTTTTRALESAVDAEGKLQPVRATAGLTLVPGYQFRITDALLTNFHLPQSSLLLLVSSFAGRDLILAAYRHAVEARYRFYSYGDC
ncbi:MAG: tRNA preQ1(34) S-adenosylmethionine ribosyltransferase-isomerase QueA, partial [Pyrinomonadaceae bacterium]